MNLGTIKQATARLRELGYSDKVIAALESHSGRAERLEFPDTYRMGEEVLNIDWQLRIDALGEVTAAPLQVSAIRVPVVHGTVNGTDTRLIEKQLQLVDWSDVSLNDKEALKAMAFVHYLARSNDPKGEMLADALALKYWSWQPIAENDLRLEELKQERLVTKTYDELPRLTRLYRELSESLDQKQPLAEKREVNLRLAEKLNAAGYHGWEIAHALGDIYRESPHSAKINFVEVVGKAALLFQMDVKFYLGGQAECLRLYACRVKAGDLEAIFELMRKGPPGPDDRDEGQAWATFNDLPPLPKVPGALPVQHPEAKIIKHQFIHPKNEKQMNLNNLDNLKAEVKQLGFSEATIQAMEENMKKNLPEFTLHEKVTGNKGQVDITIPFRQSRQSEYYYLNKYFVALNTGKPLEEGHKYMVISPDPNDAKKNLFRSFEQAGEAIAYFKEQKGTSELASGKDIGHKTTLASREDGLDKYIAPDFQRTYRGAAMTQTIYVDRGVGINKQQAANLIQGRAVYRTDLLSPEKGPYHAWVLLNMDKPKDRFANYNMLTYNDPGYGFHLEKVLENYNLKELNDPKQAEALIAALHQGERPLITMLKDGQEVKLYLQTAPRYGQINLFREDGRPEKREQYQKAPAQGQQLNQDKAKGKDKGQDEGIEV